MIWQVSLLIFVLAAVLTMVRGWVKYKYCPVCIASVVVWVAALALTVTKVWVIEPLILGILMAVSLGAFVEKYGSKYGFIWKTAFFLLGFPATYFVVTGNFAVASILILGMILVSFFSGKKPNAVKAVNDKFKDCCE